MKNIKEISAREVLDSRGNPTVEVTVQTDDGLFSAIAPSGASTGTHEALELRDGTSRFHGKGVMKAVTNVRKKIAPAIIGKDVTRQDEIDGIMRDVDGTPNKASLGANAIIATSMAVCKAGAAAKGEKLYTHIADLYGIHECILPVPSFNVINGGRHAGNGLAIQEFMIMPTGAENFRQALRMGTETYHVLKDLLKARFGIEATNVGDEGGFAPSIADTTIALDLLKEAIQKAGHEGKIQIAMDAAASEFTAEGGYDLTFKSDASDIKDVSQMIEFYGSLVESYPLISIEDPFDQEDWEAFAQLTKKLNGTQIVGDDLLVTNPDRIREAKEKNACNALLLKVNQIGTVSEALNAAQETREAGWGIMVSHRSGETEDTFIADLAVGIAAGQIKSGAPCRSERLAKYNQLLRVEEEMAASARFAGERFRKP